MSYLRPLKPRFYTDNINWILSKGGTVTRTNEGEALTAGDSQLDLYDLKPANTVEWSTDGNSTDVDVGVNFIGIDHAVNFMVIMNHNLNEAGAEITMKFNGSASQINTMVPILNATEGTQDWAAPTADGDTILGFNELTSESDFNIIITPTGLTFTADVKIGSIIIGKYYDAPFSPDMGRGLNFEFPTRITESEGGQRYSNIPWTGAPQNDYAPFRGNVLYQYGGRTVHDLSFSYVKDTDTLRSDLSAVTDSDDFQHDVAQKIMGSHLPFVFTLDSTSTVKGDYLFARMFNLSMNEIAHRVYNSTMRIEEEF